jgi:hypothetical protein
MSHMDQLADRKNSLRKGVPLLVVSGDFSTTASDILTLSHVQKGIVSHTVAI